MDWGNQLAGVIFVTAALADVYLTVLFARSGTGLISPRLHRYGWSALHWLARSVLGLGTRLLPHSGPLLLVRERCIRGVLGWMVA